MADLTTKTVVRTTDGAFIDGTAILYSVTLTAGVDAAQVDIVDAAAGAKIIPTVKAALETTTHIVLKGVVVRAIFADNIAGTLPDVSVEFVG